MRFHLRTQVPLLLLCAGTILSADQVVLKNGDIVTGTVVKKDGDKLTFKSEIMGEVTIPWSAVKSLKSDQDLVVVLPGGESVKGKISTSGDALAVAAPTPKSAPLAAIADIRNDAEQHAWERVQHPGIFQLWSGTYDLGLALTRGNARTASFTNTVVAARTTLHDKVALHFNQIYASALANKVNSTTASAVRGGWAYNRNLTPKVFVATVNDYEHDRFQNLDLRAVFGGGLGWNAFKRDAIALSFQGGADYSRESFTDNTKRNSGELNFGNDLMVKFAKVTTVTQSFRMFPNLTRTGEYRVNFDLTAVTTIRKWLGWSVNASDRFLSNPVDGRLRNDLLISTGFRLSFAQ